MYLVTPSSNAEIFTMIAFNFSRRGFFHSLLAAVALPVLPRLARSAVADRGQHSTVNYLYDSRGRLISVTYSTS